MKGKSPQRRNQSPTERDRGANVSGGADVPGPAAEAPSPPRCLPSPWSCFPSCLGPGVASPAESNERGASTGDAPVRHKSAEGPDASVHGGAQPRCQIASGGEMECSERQKASEGNRGGGENRAREGEGGRRREREGAHLVSKPNCVRECARVCVCGVMGVLR